jgi:hypothetical protein
VGGVGTVSLDIVFVRIDRYNGQPIAIMRSKQGGREQMFTRMNLEGRALNRAMNGESVTEENRAIEAIREAETVGQLGEALIEEINAIARKLN